jgi:glycerol-3-phosphate dehydrogenase
VTRREVLAAPEGPLGARSLAGLKRRMRATLGRCQGFYRSATLDQLTAGHFERPMAEAIRGR